MRLLLDTHTIIWHYENRPLLTDVAIQAIEDPANKVFISVASLWEMTIKVEIGKLNLGVPVRTIMTTYARNGALILTINPGHVFATQNLLWHHRDPFDRILIAQAISEGLTLISCDEVFKHYEHLNLLW